MQAEWDCDMALSHDPAYAKAFYRRASAREAQGRLLPALADAERALQLWPSSEEVAALHARLAAAKGSAGDDELAKTTAALQVSRPDQATLLEVREVADEGRALVAVREISAGTQVLEDLPFAAVPEKHLHEQVWQPLWMPALGKQ